MQASVSVSAPAPAPKLLKSRMRHTRYFMFMLLPVIICSYSFLGAQTLAHETVEMVGTVLVITGVFGRIFSTLFIGGRKNDEVVDTGMFSVVRNPLYFFSFVAVLGIGFQSTSISVFVLIVGAFLVYYPGVVKREEAFLRHKFGVAYDAYCARVPRWIPKFSQWSAPENVEVKPRFIYNAMLDGAMFFLPLFVFELVDELQIAGMLPKLMLLP